MMCTVFKQTKKKDTWQTLHSQLNCMPQLTLTKSTTKNGRVNVFASFSHSQNLLASSLISPDIFFARQSPGKNDKLRWSSFMNSVQQPYTWEWNHMNASSFQPLEKAEVGNLKCNLANQCGPLPTFTKRKATAQPAMVRLELLMRSLNKRLPILIDSFARPTFTKESTKQ